MASLPPQALKYTVWPLASASTLAQSACTAKGTDRLSARVARGKHFMGKDSENKGVKPIVGRSRQSLQLRPLHVANTVCSSSNSASRRSMQRLDR
ncbi:hypothetical protein D9M69_701000 [compost metagenome]